MKFCTKTTVSSVFLALLAACGAERRLEFRLEEQTSEVRALLTGSTPGADSATALEQADVARAQLALRGDYFEDPALNRVVTDFGPSIIAVPQALVRSPVAEARIKPWSSWWYPRYETTLFQSATGLSPLEKLDLYREAHSGPRLPEGSSAASHERKRHEPSSLSWEGLCNAWSLASILSPEPRTPRTIRLGNLDLTFSVGDQKALLLKTYEALPDTEVQAYGQKFTGNHDGWIHPDIFPDQFHRFVEVQLFERSQAFIMDHDPGVEIWNVPVYKANFSMSPVAGRNDAVQVRMWLYSASATEKTELNFVGTRETIREYHYILFGTPLPDGKLQVHSGVWIKGPNGVDSRKDHPDYFLAVSEQAAKARQSFNPFISPEVVDQVIRGASPVQLSWVGRGQNDQYEVQIASDSAFSRIIETLVTKDNSITFFASQPGTYYWRVRGVVKGVSGPFSGTQIFFVR
jgi:hypothetical protein